jgi:hypothetical protein
MFRGSKAKQRAEEEEEPQSPKVTCAGQIKVGRPKKVKPGPGSTAATKHGKDGVGVGDARSWITVVEEIERLHGRRKKVGWLETLGIRRDALPFLGAALRSLSFKARCFGSGSLHAAAVDSSVDSDDDGNNDAGERGSGHGAGGSAPASVFSKWLMVLEGGQEPRNATRKKTSSGSRARRRTRARTGRPRRRRTHCCSCGAARRPRRDCPCPEGGHVSSWPARSTAKRRGPRTACRDRETVKQRRTRRSWCS